MKYTINTKPPEKVLTRLALIRFGEIFIKDGRPTMIVNGQEDRDNFLVSFDFDGRAVATRIPYGSPLYDEKFEVLESELIITKHG